MSDPKAASQDPSLRERKKARTRELLLSSADELFAQQGYDKTTLDEICERADVSPRTFFRYFDSKIDLAMETSYKNAERRGKGLQSLGRRDVMNFLREDYLRIVTELKSDPYVYQRFQMLVKEPALSARTLSIDLRSEIEIGRAFRRQAPEDPIADVRSRLLGAMIVGGIRSAVRRWLESGGTDDLFGRALEVLDEAGAVATLWFPTDE